MKTKTTTTPATLIAALILILSNPVLAPKPRTQLPPQPPVAMENR